MRRVVALIAGVVVVVVGLPSAASAGGAGRVEATATVTGELQRLAVDLLDGSGLEIAVVVPERGLACGQTLKELAPAQRHSVQVVGVRRGGYRLLSPQADEKLQAGDELLALGTPAQIGEFKGQLMQEHLLDPAGPPGDS